MKKRKWLSMIMIGCLLITLTGCGGSGGSNKGNEENDATGRMIELQSDDGTYVFANASGKAVTFKGYNRISDFNNNVAIVQNEDYQEGLMNSKEKMIVPFGKYSSIHKIGYSKDNTNYYIVTADKSGLIDSTGKELLACEYESITGYQDVPVLLITSSDDTYALYNFSGQKITDVDNSYGSILIPFRLNDSVDTIIGVSREGLGTSYYNVETTKEIYKTETTSYGQDLSYNVIIKKSDSVYQTTFLDQKGNEIRTEDCFENIHKPSISAVANKYIIVEQEALNRKKESKRTVYNIEFEEVLSFKNEVSGFMDSEGNIYFCENTAEAAILYNEKGEEIARVENGSYVSLTSFPDGAPFFTVYFRDERRTAAYDFKGNKVYDSIKMTHNSGAFVADVGEESIVYKHNNDMLTLDKDQEYISYLGVDHILVKDQELYKIINLKNGKVTYETKDGASIQLVDYVELKIPVFKLKNAYYNFNGKEIAKDK